MLEKLDHVDYIFFCWQIKRIYKNALTFFYFRKVQFRKNQRHTRNRQHHLHTCHSMSKSPTNNNNNPLTSLISVFNVINGDIRNWLIVLSVISVWYNLGIRMSAISTTFWPVWAVLVLLICIDCQPTNNGLRGLKVLGISMNSFPWLEKNAPILNSLLNIGLTCVSLYYQSVIARTFTSAWNIRIMGNAILLFISSKIASSKWLVRNKETFGPIVFTCARILSRTSLAFMWFTALFNYTIVTKLSIHDGMSYHNGTDTLLQSRFV